MQYITDKYQLQSLFALVYVLMSNCDTCQPVKEYNKLALYLVILLHTPVRPWTDISIDCRKLTPVFTKCSTMYADIDIANNHMLYNLAYIDLC